MSPLVISLIFGAITVIGVPLVAALWGRLRVAAKTDRQRAAIDFLGIHLGALAKDILATTQHDLSTADGWNAAVNDMVKSLRETVSANGLQAAQIALGVIGESVDDWLKKLASGSLASSAQGKTLHITPAEQVKFDALSPEEKRALIAAKGGKVAS